MNTEHVAMTAATVERLKASCTHDADRPTWALPQIGTMFAIPVVVDDTMPAEPGWELRNRRSPIGAESTVQWYLDWSKSLAGGDRD